LPSLGIGSGLGLEMLVSNPSVVLGHCLCDYVSGTSPMCSGNKNLEALTAKRRERLRVELEDSKRHTSYALYDDFRATQYFITSVGTYSGTAGGCGTLILSYSYQF